MKQIIFLLTMTFSMFANAQTNQFSAIEDADPGSTKVLEAMKDQYLSYTSVEAAFTLTIEMPEEDAEIQKGTIQQQDDRYNLTMNDQHIISDGKLLWYHQISSKLVQINNVDPDESAEEMFSPQNFLKFYEDAKFIAAPIIVAKEDGQAVRWIELKPVDRDSEYFKFRISLDIKKNDLRSIKAFSRDGARYTLKVDKLTPNKKFTDKTFTFNASDYPDVDVEDLRVD